MEGEQGLVNRTGGVLKKAVGFRPECHDCHEADENDHGQHDGIFNSGWTVFRSHKRPRGQSNFSHGCAFTLADNE